MTYAPQRTITNATPWEEYLTTASTDELAQHWHTTTNPSIANDIDNEFARRNS